MIRVTLPAVLLSVGFLFASSASAQQEVDERRTLRADGRLDIEVTTHSLRIEPWDLDEVRIRGTVDPELQRFELRGDEEALTARVVRRGRGRPPAGQVLELMVPVGVSLSVVTTRGGVRVEGVSGAVRISTSTGAVRLAGTSPWAEVTTVTGEIDVSGAIPDLYARSGSGRVDVRGGSGRLEVNTESGPIRLRGDGPVDHLLVRSTGGSVDFTGELSETARVALESQVGAITIRVPPGTPADYHLQTFSGRIRNRLTEDEARSPWGELSSTLAFTVGAGTAQVRASSFGGGVTLDPLR